jgi:hypothetical protein
MNSVINLTAKFIIEWNKMQLFNELKLRRLYLAEDYEKLFY